MHLGSRDVWQSTVTPFAFLQTPKKHALETQPSMHIHKADTVVPDLIKDNAGVSPAGLAEAPSLKGTLLMLDARHTALLTITKDNENLVSAHSGSWE